MADHNELGKLGEAHALQYLLESGYDLLENNWRFKHEEVDLIMIDDSELVFVEVKTRTEAEHANFEDLVSNQKIRHLIDAAEAFVMEQDMDIESRFDLIVLISKGNGQFDLEHIKGAFQPHF